MLIARQTVEPTTGSYRLIRVWPNSWAKVDADDYERIKRYRWRLVRSNSCSYALRKFTRQGKTFYVRMHRQIMNCPKGMEVHHINHNTLDNRKCNLAIVTPLEHRNFVAD